MMQVSTSTFIELGKTAQSPSVMVSNLVDAGTATSTSGSIIVNYQDTGLTSVPVKNGDRIAVNTVASAQSATTVYNYLAVNGVDLLLHVVSSRSDPTIVAASYFHTRSYEDIRTYTTGFPFRAKFDNDTVWINGTAVNLSSVGSTTNASTVPVLRLNKNEVALVSTSDFKLRATITGLGRPFDAVYANNLHWISFNTSNVINAYSTVGVLSRSFSANQPRSMVLNGTTLYVSTADALVVINTTSYTRTNYAKTNLDKLVYHNGFLYATDRVSKVVRKINLTDMSETTIVLPGYPTTITSFNGNVVVSVPGLSSICAIDNSDIVSTPISSDMVPFSVLGVGTSLYVCELMTGFFYVFGTNYERISFTQVINKPLRTYAYNGSVISLDFHYNFPNALTTNDQTPQTFAFIEYMTALQGQYYESNELIVDGVNSPVSASIPPKLDGYFIVNGVQKSNRVTMTYGDKFKVVLKASDTEGESVSALVSIGTKSATYTIPAPKLNRRINTVNFDSIANATISTIYQSNAITISGLETSVPATVDQGSIIKNGVNTGSSTTIVNGDSIKLEVRSADLPGNGVVATFRANTFEAYYAVGNASPAAGLTKEEFQYVGPYGVPLDTIRVPDSNSELDPPPLIEQDVIPESTHNQLKTINYFTDQTYSSYLLDQNTGKLGDDDDTLVLIRPRYANSTSMYDKSGSVTVSTAKTATSTKLFGKLAIELSPTSSITLTSLSGVQSVEFNIELPAIPTTTSRVFNSSQLYVDITPDALVVNGVSGDVVWSVETRYHIAIDSGYIYLNGVRLNPITLSGSLTTPTISAQESILITEIRVSKVKRFLDEFTPPTTPYGNKARSAVTTDYFGDRIHLLDLDTCAVLQTIQLEDGARPYEAAIYQNKLSVSLTGLGKVRTYDLTTLTQSDELDIDTPRGLVYDSAGALYIASGDNSVIKVVESNQTITTVGSNPLNLMLDSQNRVWVTHYGANTVSVLTTPIVTIDVGISPWSLAEGSRYIYVSVTGTNQIKAIDKATLTVNKSQIVDNIPYYMRTLITGEVVVGYFGSSLVEIYDANLTEKLKSIVISDCPVTGLLNTFDTISVVSMYYNIPSRSESLPPAYLFSDKTITNQTRTFTTNITGTVTSKSTVDVKYPTSSRIVLKKNGSNYSGKLIAGDTFNLAVTSTENNYGDTVKVPILSNGNLQTITGIVGPKLTPDQFYFNPVSSAVKNNDYLSNEVTIVGIAAGRTGTITIAGGSVVKNGIDVGSTTTIDNGDKIQVKAQAIGMYGVPTVYSVVAGDLSVKYVLTTVDVGGPIQDYSSTKYYFLNDALMFKWFSTKRRYYKVAMGTGKQFRICKKLIPSMVAKGKFKRPTKSSGMNPITHNPSDPRVFSHGSYTRHQLVQFQTISYDDHFEHFGLSSHELPKINYTIEAKKRITPVIKEYRPNLNKPFSAVIDFTIDDPNTFYNFEPRPRPAKLQIVPQFETPDVLDLVAVPPRFETPAEHDVISHLIHYVTGPDKIITSISREFGATRQVYRVFKKATATPIFFARKPLRLKLIPYILTHKNVRKMEANPLGLKIVRPRHKFHQVPPLKVQRKIRGIIKIKMGTHILQHSGAKSVVQYPTQKSLDVDRYVTGYTCEEIGAYADREEAMAQCIAKGLSNCNTFTVAQAPCYMWYSPTFYGTFSVPTAWYMGGG